MSDKGPILWAFIWSFNGIMMAFAHFARVYNLPRLFTHTLPLTLTSLCVLLPFTLPENDYTFRGVLSLASCFYAIKSREVLTEKRFDSEPVWIKMMAVIGTFWDAQERRPSEPLFKKRAIQLAKLSLTCALHVGCYLLTVEVFHQRSRIAKSIANVLGKTNLATIANVLNMAGFSGATHAVDVADALGMDATGVTNVLGLYDLYRPLRVLIGCISGCLFVFFSLHVYGDVLALVWCVIGFTFPPLMDSPQMSLSVREFWKRWDTVMQKLLMKFVFTPARSVGIPANLAATFTFFASGIIHILPIIMSRPNDWLATSSMMGYFLVQLSVIVLEKPLGVYSWGKNHKWLARFWTIANLFGPSYLLVMPCLRLAGVDF